jgi:hypothetical protein
MTETFVERWLATRKGFKPRTVEEPIDYYWHRPLAGLLVDAIKSWPITPNQVTLASGVVSLLAGVVMGLGAPLGKWLSVVGGFLLLFSIVLDCADGQLARLRGTSSPVGRILDGLMDAVAPLSVMHGLAFLLASFGYSYWWVWPIGWAAGGSLLWHAQIYDVQKNVYLHCSRPDFSLGGATLLTPESMRALQHDFEAKGETANALLMRVFVRWTEPQMRAMSPWLDAKRIPRNEAERQVFVELFSPAMSALTWLGFGTHLFLLTLAAWIAPFEPRVIWGAWMIMLVPMNIACGWVVATKAKREAEYERRLAEMRGAS